MFNSFYIYSYNYPFSLNTSQDSLRPTIFTYSLSNTGYNIYSYTIAINNGCITNTVRTVGKKAIIEIYPNPTTGVLKIKCPTKDEEQLAFKLVDILGNEVRVEKYKEEIDISYLEKGIYFLSLYQNNQLLKTQKVIKE